MRLNLRKRAQEIKEIPIYEVWFDMMDLKVRHTAMYDEVMFWLNQKRTSGSVLRITEGWVAQERDGEEEVRSDVIIVYTPRDFMDRVDDSKPIVDYLTSMLEKYGIKEGYTVNVSQRMLREEEGEAYYPDVDLEMFDEDIEP